MKIFKRILKVFLWSCLILLWIFLTAFANSEYAEITLNEVNIDFIKDNQHHLITNDEVVDLVKDLGLVEGVSIKKDIHVDQIEKTLRNHYAVDKAEVYFLNNGDLHINIFKKTPIARLLGNTPDENFYLDYNGRLMKTSDSYVAKLPIFSGEIFSINDEFDSKNSTLIMDDIYEMSQLINNDAFLKSQIVQIHISNNGYFELIPRIGNHKILFGSPENMEEKLNKIKLFYTKGPDPKELNLYDTLNVMYNDQIVCSKIN
ncbi:MAG: hypothetical protein VX710_05930 [Bacteroidota bacterium]|jgi:cell division protein FtsQ|nr:hypothetical protein [Bacteroidota bacterium]